MTTQQQVRHHIAQCRRTIKEWPGGVWVDVDGLDNAYRLRTTKGEALWLVGKGEFDVYTPQDDCSALVVGKWYLRPR